MTHIILLDGKLWAFDPPEKPYQNRKEGIPTISKSWADYNRAYSLALEQRIEIDKDTVPNHLLKLLKENEPIKWEGPVEMVIKGFTDGWVPTYNNPDNSGCEQPAEPIYFVRLIAPVKEENSAMSYTEGSEADDPLSISGHIYRPPVPSDAVKDEKKDPCAYEEECQHPACNCPPTVTPFKPCPKCRTRDFASCHSMQCPMRKGEPVPSEQEKQTLPSPDEIRHALQLIQNAIEDPREASGLKEAWNLISDNLTKIEEGSFLPSCRP